MSRVVGAIQSKMHFIYITVSFRDDPKLKAAWDDERQRGSSQLERCSAYNEISALKSQKQI